MYWKTDGSARSSRFWEEENLPDSLYGYGRSNLPFNERLDIKKVKNTLDKMGWSGWLVVERSRDKDDVIM